MSGWEAMQQGAPDPFFADQRPCPTCGSLACEPPCPGPGCERHKGDPHNLCMACWALEPEPLSVGLVGCHKEPQQ